MSEFRDIVRQGYADGLTPTEIAALAGSTVGSVKVTAHKIGCNDAPWQAARKRSARAGATWSRHKDHQIEPRPPKA